MDQTEFLNIYSQAGTAAFNKGDYRTAGKMFYAAVKDADNTTVPLDKLATAQSNLAIFYVHQKRYRRAEKFFKRALANYKAMPAPDYSKISSLIHQLGDLYSLEGKVLLAKRQYQEALKIHEEAQRWHQVYAMYNSLITLELARGKTSKAMEWCKKAMLSLRKGDNHARTYLRKIKLRVASLLLEAGNEKKANIVFEEAQNLV